MEFSEGDIIIFRNKNFNTMLFSAIFQKLDNHLAMIVRYNDTLHSIDFINKNFSRNSKIIIKPIKNQKRFELAEYYVYKLKNNEILTNRDYSKLINDFKDKKFIYNFRNNFDHKYLNCATALAYLGYNLDLLKLKEWNKATKYFSSGGPSTFLFKKREQGTLKLENAEYYFDRANKVGIKDLENGCNPYKYAYLIGTIYELINLFFFPDKLKIISSKKRLFGTLVTIYCSMLGGKESALLTSTGGMRFIGGVFTYIPFVIFTSRFYKIDFNYILAYSIKIVTFRIFLTRYASWLMNDLVGNISKINNRPIDTSYFEAYSEGLIPFISSRIIKNNKISNIVAVFLYFFNRYKIENYKTDRQKKLNFSRLYFNNFTKKFTIGQMDSFIFLVLMYTQILYKNNIKNYIYLLLFFADISLRLSKNFRKNYNLKICEIIFKRSENKGFWGSSNTDWHPNKKILIPVLSLLSTLNIIEDSNKFIFILNCFSNIFERSVNGYVTDYITIKNKKISTNNFNFADTIINFNFIYGFIKNIKKPKKIGAFLVSNFLISFLENIIKY